MYPSTDLEHNNFKNSRRKYISKQKELRKNSPRKITEGQNAQFKNSAAAWDVLKQA